MIELLFYLRYHKRLPNSDIFNQIPLLLLYAAVCCTTVVTGFKSFVLLPIGLVHSAIWLAEIIYSWLADWIVKRWCCGDCSYSSDMDLHNGFYFLERKTSLGWLCNDTRWISNFIPRNSKIFIFLGQILKATILEFFKFIDFKFTLE